MNDAAQTFAAALAHHKAGRDREAALLYEEALNENPHHTAALANLATLMVGEQRLEDANRYYGRALKVDPDDSDVLSNLGNLLQSQGKFSEAEDCYRRALAHNPDLAAAHLNLANLYISCERLDEAARCFRQTLAVAPDLSPAHAGLGACLYALGEVENAETALRAALEHDSTNPVAHNNLANILAERDEDQAAAEHYHAAIKVDPAWLQPRLNLAALCARSRRHEEAETCFRDVLDRDPENLVALRGLGGVLVTVGETEDAEKFLDNALGLAPNDAEALFQMGNLHVARKQGEEAIRCFERAIEQNGDTPEFFNNMANALQTMGRPDEAIAVLERLLQWVPDFAQALNNLGNAYVSTGDTEKARDAYKRAVEADPKLSVAANNLGNTERLLGHYDEALDWFEAAREIEPDLAPVYNGIGLVLQARNRQHDAIEQYEKAIALNPDYPEALNNLAVAYQELGQFKEAIRHYKKVLDLGEERPEIYFNLGSLLQMVGRFDESVTVFNEALKVRPGYPQVYPYLAHAYMQQCSWTNLESIVSRVLDNARQEVKAGHDVSVSAFGLQSLPGDMALRLGVARQIANHHGDRVKDLKAKLAFTYHRERGARLKIGYVSPDFRFHSVAVAFGGLLKAHDKDRFAIYGYSLSTVGHDDMTEHLRPHFEGFVDISTHSYEAAARRIHDDGIDILIDLAGHTRGTRLETFALRPAPVQAHYLGYSTTVGADYIDYLITDKQQIPPGNAQFCCEELVYLPDSFMATTRVDPVDVEFARSDLNLPDEGVVFANFNSHYKFYPSLFNVWMRIMKRVPGSVLWLQKGTPTSMANLRKEAEARGVNAQRLVFSPRIGHGEHLARLRLADLCFDCLYHGGGVTTTDALWMGIPVLTLAGETTPSRNGASLLMAIGAPDLVTEGFDRYEQVAIELAQNPAELKRLKDRLTANRLTWPLFDITRLTRHLEIAYEEMWENYAAGNPPRAFEVPSLPRDYEA